MKKGSFAIVFFLFIFNSKGDTTDYWHVYLNDSLIRQYNDAGKGVVYLKLKSIQASDTLFVRYFTCAHSHDAHNVIGVKDSTGSIVVLGESRSTGTPVALSLNQLVMNSNHLYDTIFSVQLLSEFDRNRVLKMMFQIVIEP